MFQSFYESPLQHPWLLLVAPSLFLTMLIYQCIVCQKTGPRSSAADDNADLGRSSHGNDTKTTAPLQTRFTALIAAFLCLTILDPLLTGPLISVFSVPEWAAKAIAIGFVILGDFRWFFFFELFANQELDRATISRQALARAIGFSFLVPVSQAIVLRIWPTVFENPRVVFLAYELLFVGLLLAFLKLYLPKFPAQKRAFNRGLLLYALSYYGLWVMADIIILMGKDAGYLLRVLPNQLYYSFFLPFVWWNAAKMNSRVRQK